MRGGRVKDWFIAKSNPPSVSFVVQTTASAMASYVVASLFRLPEAYWAPMSTLIVMQTNLDAALPISAQHFAGTAAGAAVGAFTAAYFHISVLSFGVGVFVVGLICVLLQVERAAYRYASITVAIVMLVTRSASAQAIAIHRFFEVSIGIAVGLLFFVIWPILENRNGTERKSAGHGRTI
jgi:uncharacterized membrane protein YccC